MSKKHFSWLLIVTAVVAALVLLVPGKTGKESTFEKHPLVPGLAAVVNELDYIRVTAGGGAIIATVERSDGQWRVLEVSSYPADWVMLKALLSDLSKSEVTEDKTSNPEFYARLGVEDVSIDGAGGILIEFADEVALPALIVGKQATGREGQYLRLLDQDRSALIDRKLNVPRDRMQWLDRAIVDVSDNEVVEVTITHPDGEVLNTRKASADDADFELLNIPDGGEIKSNWTVNSISGSLSALTLDAVAPESEIDWSDAIVFSLLTADRLRLSVDLVIREDEHWIRLQATALPLAGIEPEQAADELPAAMADVAGRVNRINARVTAWAYRIPQNKFDTMTRRMADMLKAEDTP